MPVLYKGTTFATNQQVSATTLNNLVDNATFASGAVDGSSTQLSGGAIIVKDGGVTPAKLSSGGPSWDSSGNLSVPGKVTPEEMLDLSTSTAGQIKFPAVQNASSDANTLDDYEEGTWTPSLGGTATYSLQAGTYTKIGRQVMVNARLTVSSIGTGSTGIISGLPFTSGSDFGISIAYFQNIASTGFVSVYGHVISGTSTIQMASLASGGDGTTAPATFFKNGTDIIFSATYIV